MNILLIEDSSVDVSSLLVAAAKVTTRYDWKLSLVSSVKKSPEAIELADIVFLDLDLIDSVPENTIQKLVVPFASQLPMFVVTTQENEDANNACQAAGVVDWIDKSKVTRKTIEDCIVKASHILEQRENERSIRTIQDSAQRIRTLNNAQ